MYGLTRGPVTLIAAAGAGVLIWVATQINDGTTGGFWAVYGILAGAGLAMAVSQLLGGWTKWGWPRISPTVLLVAFLPALIVIGWIVVANQPISTTTQSHVMNWSGDMHVRGIVTDLREYLGVLAFGLGLLFGFTVDTTGPARVAPTPARREWRPTPATDGGREPAEPAVPAGARRPE